ncbi:MAG: outer membrane beta-barrel protein [Saprospiraceae bacterium]
MEKLFLCSLLLISHIGFGQNQYLLSGKVRTESGRSLDYGDVLVLHPTDSSLIEYTAVEQGDFSLDPLEAGDYLLRIAALGYQDYYQKLTLNQDQTITILLAESTKMLDEITVTAARNAISNKDGNLKVTIDHSIFANQATTLDVLSLLPGVQLSGDRQSLTVIGKGAPLIYLENQSITLDQLNAIPVATIKHIEIINYPSARYEAEGRAVILVTQQLNFSDGFRFDMTEIASFRHRFNHYLSTNASLKRKRLELKADFSYNYLGIWERIRNELELKERAIILDQSSLSTGPRPQFIIGGGLIYQLKAGEYFSVNANLSTHVTDAPINTSSTLSEQLHIDNIESLVVGKEHRDFFSSNISYNKKLTSSNSHLFMGIQYSNYLRDLKSDISNNYNEKGLVLSQIRDQNFQIDAFAARLDFEKTMNKAGRLELGLRYYQASADAFLDFQFLETMMALVSNYDYEERNYAAYGQYTGASHKLKYSFGLHSESTTVKGRFKEETGWLVNRRQNVLFPKATFTYAMDSSKSVTLNYAKTIQRPNYLNASSISTFIHPFLEFARNANLRSTIDNELSINFQYQNQSIRFSYVDKKDPVYFSVLYNQAQDRMVMSPQNFEQETGFDLTLTSPLSYKWWTVTNTLILSRHKIKDSRAIIKGATPYLYYYSNHQFKLPQSTVLGLFVWGLSKRKEGVFERNAYWILGGSISKTIHGKLQLAISFDDLLRAMNLGETYTINQIEAESTFFVDRKNMAFSLRYSFGKQTKANSSYRNKEIDEQLNRIN